MDNKVRIQDDLYMAVNGEWLEQAVIPEDKPLTGGFADLDKGVETKLMEDFAKFANGEKTTDIPAMDQAIAFYKKVIDEKTREEQGVKPILPLLEKIQALQTPADLSAALYEFSLSNIQLPFDYGVDVSMADATRHDLIMVGPSIILPDTTYYAPDHPAGKALLGVYSEMAKQVLAFTPLSEGEREEYVRDTLAFDALIAKSVKSQLEWADYVKNYNPTPLEEVCESLAPLDFKKLLETLYPGKVPSTIVVYDPRAIKEFKNYFNLENFTLFKHWSYVRTLIAACPYLSLTLRHIASTFRRTLMGIASDPTLEKDAYQMTGAYFAEPIGVYYGRTYFGEEAKKDVVDLVHKIIDTYKYRVRNNAFLSEATKEKAILKLSTIEVKMGYPDFVHDKYKTFVVQKEDSYFDAASRIRKLNALDNFEKLYKPVDRSEWGMPGHMVNACYNPSMNDITFPAAILQRPFYSLDQKVEENLGGIGAVIGHEISHAFDNNGAQFDEKGCLAQWWTPEDYEAFKKLTQDMIEQFDGIEIHGGKVSGELVVSENIADNGGMAVTLQIMSTLKDPSYQDYFKNWARVWCRKAKPEYMSLLLQNDVHSPAELRANMQPRNFPEWYKAFDVKPTDKMYIPEEKRIIIW